MTPERRAHATDAASRQQAPERTLARLLSIAARAAAATPGSWGYVRLSAVIGAPDASEVAHCRHDPDTVFIAHARADLPWLLDQLQAGTATWPCMGGCWIACCCGPRSVSPTTGSTPGPGRVTGSIASSPMAGSRPGHVTVPGDRGRRQRLGPELLGLKDGDP